VPPLFGQEEGGALVAVERANGGELAPLQQVLGTLYGFTPAASRPSPAGFAASARCLIEVGVVEYVDNQLGLTPQGRKLLRRSGMPNDPRHVALVTGLLQEFEEIDLQQDRSGAAPTEADVRQALSDKDQIEETGGVGTPVIGAEVPNSSSILGLFAPGMVGSHWAPAVLPENTGREADDEPPRFHEAPAVAPLAEVPEHPVRDRLFGRRRREGTLGESSAGGG